MEASTHDIEPEATAKPEVDPEFLNQVLSDTTYRPIEPKSMEETGLSHAFIESLLCKHLSVVGGGSGRMLAQRVCLPMSVVVPVLEKLRVRQIVSHTGPAPLGDYNYRLSENGLDRTQSFMRQCGYVGPAPVPLSDYVVSVDAQSISDEAPDRKRLMTACRDISIEPKLFDTLGPALNSCAGMFLYGAPGNGKTTLARHLTGCFGQHTWVPHAIIESGEIIKFFDSQYHHPVEEADKGYLKATSYDARWIKVVRPTVVIGGELTMQNLELHFHADANVSEAPLQLKSNCGCLLLDDFGRRRIAPEELLNRWIVPLEEQIDFLTLPSGKKIEVPFQQLIIFSTNLEPEDLVDEAFLRRIPYKIQMSDPSDDEFRYLFRLYCDKSGIEYRKDVVNYLLDEYYNKCNRAKRRCHARDLLTQIRNYCSYNGFDVELRPEYFDIVVTSYFAMVLKA